MRRLDKLETRLGYWLADGSIPIKPKGMHWRTYDALLVRARAAERGVLNQLGLAIKQMGMRWSL